MNLYHIDCPSYPNRFWLIIADSPEKALEIFAVGWQKCPPSKAIKVEDINAFLEIAYSKGITEELSVLDSIEA